MDLNFGPPVFGLVQELIALVFVLVSVIGWIIRTVQGNNQQMPPPVQRPGRRRDERVNDEIDSFLQQINRNQDQQQKPAEGARPAPNRPRPPGNRNQPAASQRPPAKPPQPKIDQAPSRRVREENAERPLAASVGLGSTLAQHVREHMAERVAKEAQRDVGQDVKDSVQKHLGATAQPAYAGATPTRATTEELFGRTGSTPSDKCCTTGRAENLKSMLRNPASIRQAVIIQEILNRPKCLR